MKRIFKILGSLLLALFLLGSVGLVWYARGKLPQRDGQVALKSLTAPVSVRYDERGVPHIQATNEADLYRALGFVHAQDRLFQMEVVRRLARGELAEILGPKLLEMDRLFRTLGLRAHAEAYVARMDANAPHTRALAAYLDGVNQYQATHAAPLEFDVLGIPKRDFTPTDTVAVAGYMAYSFANAFKTEPSMTYVRDQLGPDYLRIFDIEWNAKGVLASGAATTTATAAALDAVDWRGLQHLARLAADATEVAGVPAFEGSNAWVVSGQHTRSAKPLLAGDPHIAFSTPAVWYEAHLSAPGTELYGHFQALNPMALIGHNAQFGWSLTMFQNDDMDLIAEKTNPANAKQVSFHGQWTDLTERKETIAVKGSAPVELVVQRSPHGPILNAALGESAGKTPLAMWWAFLETENPVLQAFYDLNRADTLDKARAATSKIHAPGLNVMWANASGDIGWWAAAQLPIRPEGVKPHFILDGSAAESDKNGFLPFSDNPHEENPPRGYSMTANHQPVPGSGAVVPGYYNLWDRAAQIDRRLAQAGVKWDMENTKSLQLDVQTGYFKRVFMPLLPTLREVLTAPEEKLLLDGLAAWDGAYVTDSNKPTLFNQFLYELTREAMADDLGELQFANMLKTRALDHALPVLAADANSPWWDKRGTPAKESRTDIVQAAWNAALAHLKKTFGEDPAQWTWGRAHTLTHPHPLGQQKPLDRIFNVGPMAAPGGREVPNNLATSIGPAPWGVIYGPSTRRVIDFADASKAQGINPVGQSGVVFDSHYSDQAEDYVQGHYKPQHLKEADVAAATRSTLRLEPLR